MQNSILNKIGFFFVSVILLLIISSVVGLAIESNKNIKEARRLSSELQAKNIELQSLQMTVEIEKNVAIAAEQENAQLRQMNAKYQEDYKALQDTTTKKATVLTTKVDKTKGKVMAVIEEKTSTPVLTLDTLINTAGISDSQEVSDYVQAQIQESNNVILSLWDHHCLIQEAETAKYDTNPQPCSLQSL